jgi:hypothetical protein
VEHGQRVDRVFTAAELPMLIDTLLPICPPVFETSSSPAADDARLRWEADVASLRRNTRELESVQIVTTVAAPRTLRYVGGRRY